MNERGSRLEDALAAIRSGRRAEGRALLQDLVRQDPLDTTAWLWLSSVVDTEQQRRECLERVLAIDPENPHAAKGLQKLSHRVTESTTTPQQSGAPSLHQASMAIEGKPSATRKTTQKQGTRRASTACWAVAVCAIALLLCGAIAVILALRISNRVPASDRDQTPAVQSSGQWEAIPLHVETLPSDDGWQSVTIELAIKNGTGEFSRIPNYTPWTWHVDCTLTTEEGYSYPAEINFSWGKYASVVPPGFRSRGVYWGPGDRVDTYAVHSRIAQNTRPQTLVVAGYQEVDLSTVSSVSFPCGETCGSVRQSGDVIEIPGEARITAVYFERESDWSFTTYTDATISGDCIRAMISVENLNKGHNLGIKNLNFLAIGDEGLLSLQDARGGGISWKPTIGPGQTAEQEISLVVPAGSENVHFIMYGYVNAVFDTGY